MRLSLFLLRLIPIVGFVMSVSLASAAPFDGRPKLLLHVMSTSTKNQCNRGLLANCGMAETQGGLYPGSVHFVYLLVAKGDLPNISGLQCGITYQGGHPNGLLDGQGIDILTWTLCGSIAFQSPAWPAPNTGNLITWTSGSCPSGETGVAGYFYVAAYGADTLSVIARPVDGAAKVSVCPPGPRRYAAETLLAAGDLGRAVFSAGAAAPGCNPCNEDCEGPKHFIDPKETSVPMVFDSGPLDNNGDSPAVVFNQIVHVANAAWCRAYFSLVNLAPGSLLRISSLLDHDFQELDRFTIRHWGYGSAYLNGDSLRIEIIAAPHSQGNRVALERVGIELKTEANCDDGPCGACSPDGRVVSNEDWSARWVQGGCSASVYNENGCYVSAGHCFTNSGTVLAFRNPLSLNDCTVQQAAVVDQFPVLMTAAQNNMRCDGDWRVGKLGLNSQGQTHYQRYGVYMPIATAAPVVNTTARIYGFGSSSTPVLNSVQQLTVENVTSFTANGISYSGGTTTGGTSGAGIIQNNAIVGINDCCGGACTGLGTRVTEPSFVAARQAMCPHTVHVPWDKPFCKTDTEIIVPITICNTSGFNDTYTLNFAGVAPGPQCSVQGPTNFTLYGPHPVPVSAGECKTVSVLIVRPAGLTAAWLTACYDVTVTSFSTGRAVTDRGSVQDRRDLCFGNPANPTDDVGVAYRIPTGLRFNLRNDTVASGLINYRVEVMGPDMEPSGAVSLNGGYPGVPVVGSVNIPLNATGVIDVSLYYRWLERYDYSDLIVSTDLDGNGQYEPVGSVGLRSVEVPQSGVISPPTDQRVLVLHPTLPNPTRGTARLAYRVASPGPVTVAVFDVAGRLIQTVFDAPVGAGEHVVTWDGRNRFGQEVRTGSYLVRITALGEEETTKLILLR